MLKWPFLLLKIRQLWFHVKSEWQKNSEISKLWNMNAFFSWAGHFFSLVVCVCCCTIYTNSFKRGLHLPKLLINFQTMQSIRNLRLLQPVKNELVHRKVCDVVEILVLLIFKTSILPIWKLRILLLLQQLKPTSLLIETILLKSSENPCSMPHTPVKKFCYKLLALYKV